MADKKQTEGLQSVIDNVLKHEKKSLIGRAEWGTISFNNAKDDLDRIFSILNYLKILPICILTDSVIIKITNDVNNLQPILEKIDTFSIEQSNATGVRDDLTRQVHSYADQIATSASPWIPFLAYEQGDVSKNIAALTNSVKKANELIDEAKNDISKKSKEIDEIIVKAREASAAAGAAVFTQDFKNEAENLAKKAKGWLIITGILAFITLSASVVTWFWLREGLDQGQIWQALGSKLVTLSVLATSTLWCGRIYKALMHQVTINKHRALSLQTFQAFSAAASDEQTKNAVLMETTHSIFANIPTGYINPKGSGEADPKFIEIAKFLTSKE